MKYSDEIERLRYERERAVFVARRDFVNVVDVFWRRPHGTGDWCHEGDTVHVGIVTLGATDCLRIWS